ncbi:hypothetical protein C922_05777 [Plasmodium inui San Antonio 1]|uniref:Uncharacterized protein n=1 Tax=Plasmodium inui San Antonio 1 TaxID=1237626 RepID=W6ZSG1_9APIC|nr:hypothetical protein C922_05777 [Plasmodium inui San Antonio 1]EUD63842.1 hypothetical protein C922_05777 [Plasmodium inui San Antonio 1]
MYHRKDSDHESRGDENENDESEDDEDEEDENHEDEDNPDQDDNCYQRRSYYPSGARANENWQGFAYYDHEKKAQFYYDGDESEKIFTRTKKKRVKGNFRDTITEATDTDSHEEGMCLGPSAKKSQGQQHYQNRRMSRVPERRTSSGETGSEFGEASESSSLIDNFFEEIHKRIKKQPLRSLFPQTKGDSKSSKKKES